MMTTRVMAMMITMMHIVAIVLATIAFAITVLAVVVDNNDNNPNFLKHLLSKVYGLGCRMGCWAAKGLSQLLGRLL